MSAIDPDTAVLPAGVSKLPVGADIGAAVSALTLTRKLFVPAPIAGDTAPEVD